jgi:hypothetical protein
MPDYAQNYVLGRGEIHFNRFAPNTLAGLGEHYMGNTPGFEFNIEEEVLEHFSSDRGLRVKDRSVTLSNNATGQLTVDNISAETLALFMAANPGDGTGGNPNFMGISTVSQSAISTDKTENITDVRLGMWYQLGLAEAAVPALQKTYGIGVRNVDPANFDVAISPSTDVPANDGANWELDANNGRLWIPKGGTIAEGDDLIVTWQALAATTSVVVDGDQSVYGALRFISYNAVGAQRNVFLPYVKLTPAGAIALKGDDWQQAQMNLEILKLNANTPRVVTYG